MGLTPEAAEVSGIYRIRYTKNLGGKELESQLRLIARFSNPGTGVVLEFGMAHGRRPIHATQISEIERVPDDAELYVDRDPADNEPETPPATFHFVLGHDYEMEWKIPNVHRDSRKTRGGFVSTSGSWLLFDTRGPERSMEAPYGGANKIDRRWIVRVREVKRDLAKRYAVQR